MSKSEFTSLKNKLENKLLAHQSDNKYIKVTKQNIEGLNKMLVNKLKSLDVNELLNEGELVKVTSNVNTLKSTNTGINVETKTAEIVECEFYNEPLKEGDIMPFVDNTTPKVGDSMNFGFNILDFSQCSHADS